jgi:hypothetical protein
MATAIRGPAAAAARACVMYLPAFRWRRLTNRCDAGATVSIPRQAATRTRTTATRLTGFPLDHVWEAERQTQRAPGQSLTAGARRPPSSAPGVGPTAHSPPARKGRAFGLLLFGCIRQRDETDFQESRPQRSGKCWASDHEMFGLRQASTPSPTTAPLRSKKDDPAPS